MISRRNNNLTTACRGTVFLSLGMAFLILVGEIPAQENAEKNSEGPPTTLQSKISNFFSSLRQRNKQEIEDDYDSEPVEQKKSVTKSAPSNSKKPSPTPAKPSQENDKSTTAPLPPEIAYFENKTGSGVPVSSESTQTSVLVATRSPAGVGHRFSQPEEPTVSSMSSYSFDSRDWVEYFPVEHLAENNEPVVHDPFSSNQTTVVVAAPPSEAKQSSAVRNTSTKTANDWNGAAMPVKASNDPPIRQASAANPVANVPKTKKVRIEPVVPEDTDEIEEEEENHLGIDLKPSYAKKLKHTEVCGVVVVQSNFPLTEIKAMLEEIRLLQRDLNLYMGVPAPREKIELCLFRNEATYIQFLRETFPKAPRDRRALYIKLDGKPGTLLVQKTPEFEVDLRHEMTHAIIHASIRDVPIWLDEGLAKYFEVPIQNRAANNPYMKQIRWNVRFGGVPQLNRLEKLEHIGEMGAREYRDSWAWVHFMIHHSPQTHRLLAGYLQMLATLPENADAKGKSDSVRIPPLSLYLDDMMSNPRENYRTHFRGPEND